MSRREREQDKRKGGRETRKQRGVGLLNRAINALPFELHLPGYQFCGPGTRLTERLARGERGVNPLDAACRKHDIAYSRSNDLRDRHAADRQLAENARARITASDAKIGEKIAATAVWGAMKAKTKLGAGKRRSSRRSIGKASMKTRSRKRRTTTITATARKRRLRTLPLAKRGGLLPLLPILGTLGSLIGGAAGVAKAINDKRSANRQLEEMQRHNRAMEGQGLYLAPYIRGRGTSTRSGTRVCRRRKRKVTGTIRTVRKKKSWNQTLTALRLPLSGVTTNTQLNAAAHRLNIQHFRGVFMRDALPRIPRHIECLIVNLDNTASSGTHWVACAKKGNIAIYFDSFGNLRPPYEIEDYFGNNVKILYNHRRHQTLNRSNCGQLCLRFLHEINWQRFNEAIA